MTVDLTKYLGEYTVASGDTPSGISQMFYGSGDHWMAIYEANKNVIGAIPDDIIPGLILAIPRLQEPNVIAHHTVVDGDSLGSIAQKYYGSAYQWKAIYEANQDVIGANPDLIRTGLVLKIPAL